MAGNVDKGKVVLVSTTTARVVPYGPETVSYDVVIPEPLRGQIEKNMPVIYATFADRSGIILYRADGEGGGQGGGSEVVQQPHVELIGESTDTKPATWEEKPIPRGSFFLECDTQDLYYYTGTQWKKVGWNNGGE